MPKLKVKTVPEMGMFLDIVRLSQRGQSAKEQAATVSVECPTL
jgi:hypothetical protein